MKKLKQKIQEFKSDSDNKKLILTIIITLAVVIVYALILDAWMVH